LRSFRLRIRPVIILSWKKPLGRTILLGIWRPAVIAGEEENWIERQLPASSDAELLVTKLRALPVALQRRAIFKWLREQNISEVGFDVVERVRSLLDPNARVAKTNLAHDRHARRRAGRIFVQ